MSICPSRPPIPIRSASDQPTVTAKSHPAPGLGRDTNDRQAIFRLPNEILRCIALHLPECHSYGEFNSESFPAFALSMTCRRWRNIPLSVPECWRAIPYNNERWMEICFERARNTHPNIDFDNAQFQASRTTRGSVCSSRRWNHSQSRVQPFSSRSPVL